MPSRYLLTTVAQEDLTNIRDYYWDEAGHRITRQMLSEFVEAFRFLARNPSAGHRRKDLAEDRPILFWPVRDFLVLYKAGSKPLQIIAVVHGSRDLPSLIRRRRL